MESFIVIIALLALVGGVVALVLRQGLLPWPLPALRASRGVEMGTPEPELKADDAAETPLDPVPAPTPFAAVMPAKPSIARVQNTQPGASLEPVRLDLVPAPNDGTAARLDRIEARLDELHRAIARQSGQFAEEARRVQTELLLRAETEEARRQADQERLRADLLSTLSRVVPDRQAGTARRLEVSAELYAQLARLEAALATVTNPILLPGEPYAPPAELLPEALVWENWNDVGERTFALAESYSAQRLHLSAQTRSDVGTFVTTLRTLLTRSVYPNLQAEPDVARQAALRAALVEIAAELPKVRDMLETEYLEGRSV